MFRKVLGKLRTGSLPLEIEKGRFAKPKVPLEQRVCKYCNSSNVEDEKHFLIDCDLYTDIRYELCLLMSRIYPDLKQLSSLQKYCLLLNEGTIQSQLAKTVYKMYTRRKEFSENIANED